MLRTLRGSALGLFVSSLAAIALGVWRWEVPGQVSLAVVPRDPRGGPSARGVARAVPRPGLGHRGLGGRHALPVEGPRGHGARLPRAARGHAACTSCRWRTPRSTSAGSTRGGSSRSGRRGAPLGAGRLPRGPGPPALAPAEPPGPPRRPARARWSPRPTTPAPASKTSRRSPRRRRTRTSSRLVKQIRDKIEEMKQPGVDVREALAKLSEMQSAIAAQQALYNVGLVDSQMKSLGEAWP